MLKDPLEQARDAGAETTGAELSQVISLVRSLRACSVTYVLCCPNFEAVGKPVHMFPPYLGLWWIRLT